MNGKEGLYLARFERSAYHDTMIFVCMHRSFRPPLGLAVAAALAAAACEAPAGRAGGDASRRVIPAGEPPARSLVERFRLGGPDAPEPETFQRTPSVAVASDGHLFLLVRSANEVRVFGPDGRYERVVGGEGEGPGEFGNAVYLGLVGDTLWMRNLSPPFVSFFSREGAYLRTRRIEEMVISRTGVPEGPEAMLQGGRSFSRGIVPLGGPRTPVEVPLLIFSADRTVRDTIGTVVDPPGVPVPGLGTRRGIRPGPRPPLYDVVPGGAGVVVATWGGPTRADGEVTLERFGPTGQLERTDTIAFQPVPLAPSTVDSIVAAGADSAHALAERIQASGIPDPPELPSDVADQIRESLDLGSAYPPIGALRAGIDGTVWMERIFGPSSDWVAFDASGDPLFRVQLPTGHALRAASRDAIWTSHVDALDVPYVSRYDLEPTGVR